MNRLEDRFRSVLTHCQANGDLVEVYLSEEDLGQFTVGIVESVASENFAILSIDPEGEFDGRVVTRLDEIVRLHVGGDYLDALKLLHEGRGVVYDREPAPYGGPPEIPANLRFARDQRILVSVEDFDKGSTVGFVSDLGEDWVQIEPITRDGRSNGFTILRTEDIVKLSIGGKREQARGFVHQSRLGK